MNYYWLTYIAVSLCVAAFLTIRNDIAQLNAGTKLHIVLTIVFFSLMVFLWPFTLGQGYINVIKYLSEKD